MRVGFRRVRGEMADRVAYHAAAGLGYGADDGTCGRASLQAGVLLLGCGSFVANGRRLLAEGDVAGEDDVDSVREFSWQEGKLGMG